MPVADRVIEKRIKAIDPQLWIDFDFRLDRWTVRRAKGSHPNAQKDPVIMVVRNDDNTYRPLDDRLVTRLHEADSWSRNVFKEMDERNRAIERKRDADFSDYVQQVAKEDLYRAFFGSRYVRGSGPIASC